MIERHRTQIGTTPIIHRPTLGSPTARHMQRHIPTNRAPSGYGTIERVDYQDAAWREKLVAAKHRVLLATDGSDTH